MTKARWFGVAAVVLCSAAGAGWVAASADDTAPARAERRGDRGQRMVNYLGLTEQQQAQWKTLHQQERERMKPLVEEGKALRQRLHEALNAAPPDPRAVGEATIALEAHREKVHAQRQQFQQQLTGILDAQQKQKLEAFQEARRTMGRGRGGHGFGGPARGHGGPIGG